jgi:ribosomal protein L37AE/L43A
LVDRFNESADGSAGRRTEMTEMTETTKTAKMACPECHHGRLLRKQGADYLQCDNCGRVWIDKKIDRSRATREGSIRLVPAYGRDYRSVAEVKAALLANLDFRVFNLHDADDGRYVNLEQIKPGTEIWVRYARLTKQARLVL